MEFVELCEERARKIERSSGVHRIPLVLVPFADFVDGVGLVGRVNGEDLLPCAVTLAMVQAFFVPPAESSLHPAIRTQCWRRNSILFSVKNRRDTVIEVQITLCDVK